MPNPEPSEFESHLARSIAQYKAGDVKSFSTAEEFLADLCTGGVEPSKPIQIPQEAYDEAREIAQALRDEYATFAEGILEGLTDYNEGRYTALNSPEDITNHFKSL